QAGEIAAMTATVDSIDNLESTVASIKDGLGADKVDVTSAEQNIQTAIASLESVKSVSMVGFVAALIAAGVIIFLIMTVIVRERRREIGVLKAIGAGNTSIVAQFMAEAMVLVALGAAVGVGGALVGSNGIANALVNSKPSSSEEGGGAPAKLGAGGPGAMRFGPGPGSIEDTQKLVGDVTTTIGIGVLLYGLLMAFGIALIGSALPAWFIAKIRPAEVMRGE
ncbi:protein of unknown function DUF214, partial [candidate division TM7 genomosp. GTL1]